MNKKICFFISSIGHAGGTERVSTIIANNLARLGYQVSILSMYGDDPFFQLEPEIKVATVFTKKGNSKLAIPMAIFRVREKIIDLNPDILINVDVALFLYSYISGLGLRFKNIVWEHFNFNVSLDTTIRILARKLAAKYSDTIITLTHKDSFQWNSKLKCKARLVTINNPSPFENNINNDTLRRKIVLSVGRLTYQKGFDRLLDAWRVVKEYDEADWQLHIVGSGELRDELNNKVYDLAIDDSVTLIPVTTDIQQHYLQASIYCMTSRFEGFPMVLLEAQAFGLPLISYDCETGPSEIINKENGILVEDGNTIALANSIIYLINHQKERLKLGQRSFENSHNFKAEVIIDKWVNLFNTIININGS